MDFAKKTKWIDCFLYSKQAARYSIKMQIRTEDGWIGRLDQREARRVESQPGPSYEQLDKPSLVYEKWRVCHAHVDAE